MRGFQTALKPSPSIQPSAKVLLNEDFVLQGLAPNLAAGAPNARVFPAGWQPFDPAAGALAAAWVDPTRQVGAVRVNAPLDNTLATAGMIRKVPAGLAALKRFWLYANSSILLWESPNVDAKVACGILVSDQDLDLGDGKFLLAGFTGEYSGGESVQGGPYFAAMTDHATVSSFAFNLLPGNGIDIRLLVQQGIGEFALTQVSAYGSLDSTNWTLVPNATYLLEGPLKWVGIAGFVQNMGDSDATPMAASYASNHVRIYSEVAGGDPENPAISQADVYATQGLPEYLGR